MNKVGRGLFKSTQTGRDNWVFTNGAALHSSAPGNFPPHCGGIHRSQLTLCVHVKQLPVGQWTTVSSHHHMFFLQFCSFFCESAQTRRHRSLIRLTSYVKTIQSPSSSVPFARHRDRVPVVQREKQPDVPVYVRCKKFFLPHHQSVPGPVSRGSVCEVKL